MFAISTREQGKVITVAGYLTEAEIPALDQVLAAAAPGAQLELSELRGVHAAGAACLRRWRDHGIELVGASHLVTLLLASGPDLTRHFDTDSRSDTP